MTGQDKAALVIAIFTMLSEKFGAVNPDLTCEVFTGITNYFWDTKNPLVKISLMRSNKLQDNPRSIIHLSVVVAPENFPKQFLRLGDRIGHLQSHEAEMKALFPVSSASKDNLFDDDIEAFAREIVAKL